jgi:hypothetical protein
VQAFLDLFLDESLRPRQTSFSEHRLEEVMS